MTAVGIVDLESYLPATFQRAEQIAELSGVPAGIIRDKFGLEGKHLAAPDEPPSLLAAKAASPLLARIGPPAPNALLYFGSPHRDYPVWSAAPKVQQLLGMAAAGSFAFDIQGVSAGAPFALQVAKGLIVTNPLVNRVLLVGASREHDLVDYRNERSRFMFNFGAGAVAVMLERDYPANHLLATTAFTDGRFADDVMVPAGGALEPASHETVDQRRHYLDVRDPVRMKALLDPLSAANFVRVARQALDQSGYRFADVALLCSIHIKRSLFCQILEGLGLDECQAIYLSDCGHMSAIDPLVGLSRARRQGRLKDGDVVLLLTAGTGYSWAASVIRWGRA